MRLYKALLWLIGWLRIEEKTIRLLKTVRADEVKEGQLYEHYGRVFVAERNPNELRCKYTIVTSPAMGAVSADLLVRHADELEVEKEGERVVYFTRSMHLGEELKKRSDITVMEEWQGMACERCDLGNMCLPCANCDFRHTFRLLSQRRQNATNQEAWMRMMKKRIER